MRSRDAESSFAYGGETEVASNGKIKENERREERMTKFYVGIKLTN